MKTSKKENIRVGLLLLPFALIIDAVFIVLISNLTISNIFENLIFISITAFLAILFTRSTIVLIIFPEGLKKGNLIHPIILLLIYIFAFIGLISALILYFGFPETRNDTTSNSRGFAHGLTILLTLPILIIYQFEKVFKLDKKPNMNIQKNAFKKNEKKPKRKLSRKRQRNRG